MKNLILQDILTSLSENKKLYLDDWNTVQKSNEIANYLYNIRQDHEIERDNKNEITICDYRLIANDVFNDRHI